MFLRVCGQQERPRSATSFICHDPGLRYHDQFMDRVHEFRIHGPG